jgi:hypothetical protein
LSINNSLHDWASPSPSHIDNHNDNRVSSIVTKQPSLATHRKPTSSNYIDNITRMCEVTTDIYSCCGCRGITDIQACWSARAVGRIPCRNGIRKAIWVIAYCRRVDCIRTRETGYWYWDWYCKMNMEGETVRGDVRLTSITRFGSARAFQ